MNKELKDDIRRKREHLRQENAKYSRELTPVPESQWPKKSRPSDMARIGCWRSRDFLVQTVQESAGIVRITVNRTILDDAGQWRDEISWDELQKIKSAIGYGLMDAVEIFPPDAQVVNVANMRHLWVIPEGLDFGWKADGSNRD